MQREELVRQFKSESGYWDVLVIGGGATGLGVAVDASARGYKTLLLEKHDFAKATSSRSTKLVHGGVRYLQQGDVSLVIEALRERGFLLHNAPHLVSNRSFIVPSYEWWNGPFYGIGLKVYDMLAGKLGFGSSKTLSREETLERIPTLEPEGLRGGVIYHDGQFDDSRMAINLAQTVIDKGGIPLNYMEVTGLLKSNGFIDGVEARDVESGEQHKINARVVINATGIFSDSIIRMDEPDAERLIQPAQGVHLVLDKDFLPGESAIMVPHTDDGRVLFAVPWHDKVIVGTTDTPREEPVLEPRPLKEEIAFILRNAGQYLAKNPTRDDVRSAFAGLRPLVKPSEDVDTSEISRSHHLQVSRSGLVTIAGGKWTTYRKMAEDTIDQAILVAGLEQRDCPTENMRIHGWLKNVDRSDPLFVYGSDAVHIRDLMNENSELKERLHPDFPYVKAQVVWAVRNEMARTVEDVLARRTRLLLLDAQASKEAAPEVARLIAAELDKSRKWQNRQVESYCTLADGYLV